LPSFAFNPFLRSKGKQVTNISIRINENIVTDQHSVVEVMGDYFSTMANDIGGQHVLKLTEQDFNNHQSVKAIRRAFYDSHFQFEKTNHSQVENELRKLNTSKAPGWDEISPKILNLTAGAIAASLTGLFNNCISTGQWPRGWKMGVLTPVFKKDDRTNCANYRPITDLNSVAKVFESLLSKQISDKTDSQMYSKMSAYRKMHSCETNLIRVTEDWKKAMDNKECVAVLSTDMSKAFDSLHHALMIKKLEAYGFSHTSLELMRSYFQERKNRVKINGVTSSWKDQSRGCP